MFGLTLEGQYIIRHLVIIGAALVRDGRLDPEPSSTR
jgi:hypothetical protein